MYALYGGPLRELCLHVMTSVWKDLALPAARTSLDGSHAIQWTQERRCIWQHTPSELQEELLAFAEAQSFEDANCQTKEKQKLLAFAKEFFVACREERTVRPLCMLLGYVRSGA